jgi:hypothetical protein
MTSEYIGENRTSRSYAEHATFDPEDELVAEPVAVRVAVPVPVPVPESTLDALALLEEQPPVATAAPPITTASELSAASHTLIEFVIVIPPCSTQSLPAVRRSLDC